MIKYCKYTHKTIRRETREVMVGSVGIGGKNPIRIQSMTTSNTCDIDATVKQIMQLSDAGCEIARITVQGMKEANSCEEIKNELVKSGYNIPLVADIHFFPAAAMRVADFADKVRINPGNFVDKRASFKTLEYSDASYAKEVEKIEKKFTPLVLKCKQLKRAIRIGTNHGSLSDRIMNRYGDTPKGMVESALEFAEVCRKNNFHDFIFSMKSSNPRVMILAYRLLVAKMMSLGWDYPIHLGVTEAGEGEDGRIKSSIGIGSLLLDGIGDTIRVSLTENAINEIDPCKRLISFAKSYEFSGVAPFKESKRNIEDIKRRTVVFPKDISIHQDGSVILSINGDNFKKINFYNEIIAENTSSGSLDPDCLLVKEKIKDPESISILKDLKKKISIFSADSQISSVNLLPLADLKQKSESQIIDTFSTHSITKKKFPTAVLIEDESPNQWDILEEAQPSLIFLSPTKNRLHYSRHFFEWLQVKKIQSPVILNFLYTCSKEDLIIQSAVEYGALLCDGLGDGICIQAPYDTSFLLNLSFNILQASRMRTFKTEFISCPSCGRTLFDLQDVSKRIRLRTSHLSGVKIAIMGCIVNGPGEMADADFGYVGSKPGMIDLYVGKQCVEKNIRFEDADERLIDLIKKNGRWVDPEVIETANY